jgi:SAM-dependent methyltransferase
MIGTDEGATDFRWLDFSALWRGRGKTTAVEQLLARELLAQVPHASVLEVGAGEGRITRALVPEVSEYVALDRHPTFLARLEGPSDASHHVTKIASNTYRLPFRSGSFDGVVMIRVYNFLRDPSAVLREFHRVLRPGGWVIVSYNPRPSLATLVDDLRCFLWNDPSSVPMSQTFARVDSGRVYPSPVPAWASTIRTVHRTVALVGFDILGERASGFEDYRGLRRLPVPVFLGAARAFPSLVGFPHRFLLARRRETTGTVTRGEWVQPRPNAGVTA